MLFRSGTWADIIGDNIQVSEDITSIDTNVCNLFYGSRVKGDEWKDITNPDPQYGEFWLTHGDYIIVTVHEENGNAANAGATIEMAEEI